MNSSTEKSSDDFSNEPVPPKRKRGIRNDDSYKRNAIKRCRVKGHAYVGYSNKQVVARKIGPPCR